VSAGGVERIHLATVRKDFGPLADGSGTACAWRRRVSAVTTKYVPRRPESTVLYALVRDSLETFVEHARERYAKPLPKYVVDTFRSYLRCGIPAYGFLRAHCDDCGHDLLVAFSCKGRGICPSCAGRRMCNEAAHLVDRVLPNVPVRQYVLSLPYPIRKLAAFDARVLRGLVRIFVDGVLAAQRTRAGFTIKDDARGGAVTFIQRFGGSLNLNVHFHVMVLDGVFTREGDRLEFYDAPAPTRDELRRIVRTVHRRMTHWLHAHGHLGRADGEDDAAHDDALEACANVAATPAGFVALKNDGTLAAPSFDDAERTFEQRDRRFSANHEGFDLHAAVRIDRDDEGRERLARYCARPSFAIDRFTRLRDGRIAFHIKHARRGATHRVMEPLQAMAHLSALIPPPRYPLIRYHGVLAPNAAWRKLVVPRAPERAVECAKRTVTKPSKQVVPDGAKHRAPNPPQACQSRGVESTSGPPPKAQTALIERAPPKPTSPSTVDTPPLSTLLEPVTEQHYSITNVHLRRLLDGALLAIAPRIDWARLMRRSLDLDALECSRCGSRLRVLAAITEASAAKKILRHVGLSPTPPPVARARDPSDLREVELESPPIPRCRDPSDRIKTAIQEEHARPRSAPPTVRSAHEGTEVRLETTLEDIEPDPWHDREEFA